MLELTKTIERHCLILTNHLPINTCENYTKIREI